MTAPHDDCHDDCVLTDEVAAAACATIQAARANSSLSTRVMRRFAIAAGLAASALAVCTFANDATAQPAFAIGKPLPDSALPTGTVVVRVIAGSTSAPAVGVDATLVVGGTPRQARTDASGRATFAGLPAGAVVVAKVTDEDKKEIASDEFAVPAAGGARVLLSTKPLAGAGAAQPAGAAAPPMRGGAGMPTARQISGQPRPDGGEVPGVYAVRVTYDQLQMGAAVPDASPPTAQEGGLVHLVAYGANDTITLQSKQIDATGVAKFDGLDQSGGTSYFALTSLKRGSLIDRLVSIVVLLDSQAGARVVLSGEKRDSTAPAINDYDKLVRSDGRADAAGTVRVTLDGAGQLGNDITLFDIKTGKPVGTGKAAEGAPDPTQIQGSANFTNKADVPAKTVVVAVQGGAAQPAPLPGVAIQLIVPEEAETPIAGAAGVTGADGSVRVTIPADFTLPERGVIAKVTINGKDMYSSPMDVSAQGGQLDLTAQWSRSGKPEAIIAAPPVGSVLYAETEMSGQKFRSPPFEILDGTGVHVNVYIYPRTLFSFDTHAFVEDQLLAVQGNFEVTNYSWAPYRAGNDGLLIELPARFKGAIIAPQDQNDVSVATGEGFRIVKPIPPGGRKFRAGFSMPIENGVVDWNFKLPLGSWNSTMRIRQTPGMSVQLPPKLQGATQTATTGEPWFIIENITIERKTPFKMTISGFPAESAWRVWGPRFAGVIVLMLVLGGLGYALTTRDKAAPKAEDLARREKLMDELVALEKRGISSNKDRQRREQLVDELERTWGT